MDLLKYLPNLLTPLTFYVVLLAAVLAWRSKGVFWWCLLMWAYVMSVPAVSGMAIRWLEAPFMPITAMSDYQGYPVVVLSAGATRKTEDGWVNRLGEAGWERLLVGLETVRATGGKLYIPGGVLAPGGEPIAKTMRTVLGEIGIDQEVEIEQQSKNTYQNLAFLQDRLEGAPFILVTSTTHLRRAMAVAEHLGLDAIPEPADRQGEVVDGLISFLPSAKAVKQWQIVLHEVVGWWVYRWRGHL